VRLGFRRLVARVACRRWSAGGRVDVLVGDAGGRAVADGYTACRMTRYTPCHTARCIACCRTGVLVGEDPMLEKGATLTVQTDDEWKEKCDKDNLYMDYKNLPKVITVGGIMFIDDGLISIKVTEINGGALKCEVMNAGRLGSRKGVNLPNVDVRCRYAAVTLTLRCRYAAVT
jgi:hypothetical protein